MWMISWMHVFKPMIYWTHITILHFYLLTTRT